jgi:anti-sigma factor RsiW
VQDLSCREFTDFILAYLDGELQTRARALFEAHIRDCPPCLDYLDSYRQTVELAGQAWTACGPDDAVPQEAPEELVRAMLEARRHA